MGYLARSALGTNDTIKAKLPHLVHAANELGPHRAKHLHVWSGAPTASPVWQDGLRAPDTVLGRAVSKNPLGRADRGGKVCDAPQIPLGPVWGAARDAFTPSATSRILDQELKKISRHFSLAIDVHSSADPFISN
jgi:hypothetical protein